VVVPGPHPVKAGFGLVEAAVEKPGGERLGLGGEGRAVRIGHGDLAEGGVAVALEDVAGGVGQGEDIALQAGVDVGGAFRGVGGEAELADREVGAAAAAGLDGADLLLAVEEGQGGMALT